MRQKTVVALAIVTIPVALAAAFIPAGNGGEANTGPRAELFPGLKDWIGSATKLTVIGAGGKVELARKGGEAKTASEAAEGWVLPSKGSYPVPADKVRPILTGLVALRQVEPKTAETKLYARLEVDNPGAESKSHEIELTKGDGANILKLVVGKKKYDPLGQGNDGIYVRKPGDPQTWLVRPAFEPPEDELSWLDRHILDIDPAAINDVVVTPTNGKPFEVARAAKDDKLQIKDLPKDAKLKPRDVVSTLGGAFNALDLDDVEPAGSLTGQPASVVHFTTFDGLDGTVKLYKDDGAWITIQVKGTGDAAKQADEIAKRTGAWAYKIEDSRGGTFTTQLADALQPPDKPAAATPPAKAKAATPG